jgi:RNA polymerase sigma-70 factor (ECF subfamily)
LSDHNHQEFEGLTLPLQKVLYQSARSMLGNNAAAEDAVLETYLQAWRSFDKFELGTNCRAWMFRILLNVVRHERRKWAWRFQFPKTPEVFEKTLAYHAPVAEELADQEILAALREIPQKFSEVVILCDVQEFSYKEIQTTLDIPIGTVMSRLSRGREMLRGKLAHRADELGFVRTPAPDSAPSQGSHAG